MALTQTQAQIAENVRQFADVKGTTALLRHPNANVYDYINRAFGSIHRKLTEAGLGDRFISTTTVSITSGTSTYALPATFDHLLSVNIEVNGSTVWLKAFEENERAALTDSNTTFTGIPFAYRLRASNIEFLPVPTGDYEASLYFTPTPTSLATDGTDASTIWDTINRLDDYVIAYAAQFIFVKDKRLDMLQVAKQLLDEIGMEISAIGRSRDRNSPPRIRDEMMTNRYGRRLRLRGY